MTKPGCWELVHVCVCYGLPMASFACSLYPQADFEIQQVLAAGGQGTVRKALRRADGRPFVIKTVDLSRMTPFDRELQRNEAKVRATRFGCAAHGE